MNGFTEQERDLVRGLDPAVVTEFAKQMKVTGEVAAEQIKRLGQALLDQELEAKADQFYTNRKARRARERAGRKRGLQ